MPNPLKPKPITEERALSIALLAIDDAMEKSLGWDQRAEFQQTKSTLTLMATHLEVLKNQDDERRAQMASMADEIEQLRGELAQAGDEPVEAEGSLVHQLIAPVLKEMNRAFASVLEVGHGAVSLRFEHGRIKRVIFEGAFLAPKVVDKREH